MANLRVNKITSTETFETTGSVQFDGSGDYLSLTNIADFRMGSDDFTVECWVYPPSSGANQGVVGIWEASSGRTWLIYLTSVLKPTFIIDGDGSGGGEASAIGPDALPLSTWTHLAGVRHGDYITLYVNGTSVAKVSAVTVYNNTSDPLEIGRFNSGNEFEGYISNVRVVKGRALYTENFKPSMRELEVVPGTVLLACQSKTDASLEKTGKTITANGNAVASELTPGILTPVPKDGAGSAITGSVEFVGKGDANYLTIANNSDHNFDTGDFTIEMWFRTSITLATHTLISKYGSPGSYNGWYVSLNSSGTKVQVSLFDGSSTQQDTSGGPDVNDGSWHHFAISRSGSSLKLFVDGVEVASATNSYDITSTSDVRISGYAGNNRDWDGFISNLRIVKGTALYTDDFIPPTRELKKVPGTVLLCCQDENSATTEATGKTITVNGTPTASNFTPQVGDDRKVTFEGVTKVNSDAYFYLPTGDTITRDSRRGRGVQGAGYYYVSPAQTYVNTISYYEISTTGNALDFGDLKDTKGQIGSLGSATRGVFAGASQPDVSNAMDYITIASTGNALEFGDMTDTKWGSGGVANSTRGLFAGGRQPGWRASIDFITIASTGNAADFGDLSNGEQNHEMAAASSPTRGVFAGGSAPGSSPYISNKIDFVTISSTGNAQDFGDLPATRKSCTGVASQTRMCVGGGINPGLEQSIEYLTIPSKGNSQTFGDLTGSEGRWGAGGTSNSIRGVFGGGYDPSPAASYNTMDYITIASTGDAQDFGDIGGANGINVASGLSDAHGGLG